MSKDKKEISLIKRGLLLTQTIFFRVLVGRATGIINSPIKVLSLVQGTYQKVHKYENREEFTTDVIAGFYLFTEMVRQWISGKYRGFETQKVLLILACLLYFISPLDILPDYIPFIGLLDDISLMAWLYKTLQEEVVAFVLWQQSQNETDLTDLSYEELYVRAQELDLRGRSKMSKRELLENLTSFSGNGSGNG